jgi:uncharacterized protein YoaH (UPF0181 family)
MALTKQEEQIQKMMKALGISREEALEVIADDKRIDKGEKLFELNAEQEKASKQARQADRKPTVYKLDNEKGKRSKKVDEDKAFLLNELFKAILPNCETYEIQNGEREFTFTYHEKKYKVVLSAPRS